MTLSSGFLWNSVRWMQAGSLPSGGAITVRCGPEGRYIYVARTELPWRVFGRRIHPFSFSIFIATTTISIYLLGFGEDAGDIRFRAAIPVFLVGVTSTLASLALLYGFLRNSRAAMRLGLLAATGVFVARCALWALEVGWDAFPLWISLALAVGSAGAWLLERADDD